LPSDLLGEAQLQNTFDKFWPDFEKTLFELQEEPSPALKTPTRSDRDLLTEILEEIREVKKTNYLLRNSLVLQKSWQPLGVESGASAFDPISKGPWSQRNMSQKGKLLDDLLVEIKRRENLPQKNELLDDILNEIKRLGGKTEQKEE